MTKPIARILTLCLLFAGSACTRIPADIEPVENFELERYLGTWYEIARLDHGFEKGLAKVSAQYSQNDDGSIEVINRGFNQGETSWEEARGRALFVGETNSAHLKVSFFGPFYSSYVVFDLPDNNYQQAYVSGYNKNYLWFLSRSPVVSDAQREAFLARARRSGFNTRELIWVEHNATELDNY